MSNVALSGDPTTDVSARPVRWAGSGTTTGTAIRRLAGLAIAGQLAFALLWFVAGVVEPHYNPARQTISELAALDAHHPWIVSAAFIVFGVSLVAVALTLYHSSSANKRARLGTGMVLVAAAFMPLVAGARMDCARSSLACRARIDADLVSGHHHLHDLASLVVFLMLVWAPLVFARRFRPDPRWRDLRPFSRATTAVAFALLVAFVVVADGTSVGGIVQRALLAVIAAWIIVVARRAQHLSLQRAS